MLKTTVYDVTFIFIIVQLLIVFSIDELEEGRVGRTVENVVLKYIY